MEPTTVFGTQGLGINTPTKGISHGKNAKCGGHWEYILSRKLKKGSIKTTVPLKRGYMGFHVSLGECSGSKFATPGPKP